MPGLGWLAETVSGFKTVQSAYELARNGIASVLPKHTKVAITGMAGAGKSVLYDYLSRNAYEEGYKPPEQSVHLDVKNLTNAGRKIVFSIVPGQSVGATQRVDAIDAVFSGKARVDLLIHVVANFDWDVMPVCTHLEPFAWHRQTIDSALSLEDRNKLVAAFLRRIQSFCKQLRNRTMDEPKPVKSNGSPENRYSSRPEAEKLLTLAEVLQDKCDLYDRRIAIAIIYVTIALSTLGIVVVTLAVTFGTVQAVSVYVGLRVLGGQSLTDSGRLPLEFQHTLRLKQQNNVVQP